MGEVEVFFFIKIFTASETPGTSTSYAMTDNVIWSHPTLPAKDDVNGHRFSMLFVPFIQVACKIVSTV